VSVDMDVVGVMAAYSAGGACVGWCVRVHSSLIFQMELISLWISERIVLRPALISSTKI